MTWPKKGAFSTNTVLFRNSLFVRCHIFLKIKNNQMRHLSSSSIHAVHTDTHRHMDKSYCTHHKQVNCSPFTNNDLGCHSKCIVNIVVSSDPAFIKTLSTIFATIFLRVYNPNHCQGERACILFVGIFHSTSETFGVTFRTKFTTITTFSDKSRRYVMTKFEPCESVYFVKSSYTQN